MKIKSCLWLSVLALGACSKEQPLPACTSACTTIKGRLVTAGGQEGLGGATVTATWVKPTTFGANLVTKARTTTDAAGNYSLSFFINDSERTSSYFSVFYLVDKERYYTIGEPEHAFYKLKRDTTYTVPTFLVPRLATVNVTVPNASQIQGSFDIELSTTYGHNLTLTKNQLGDGLVFGVPVQAGPFTYTASTAGDQKVYLGG